MNERGNVYPIDRERVAYAKPPERLACIDGNTPRRQSRIFAKAQKL